MAAEEIQVILFDFGGVIAEEGFRNGLAGLAQEQGLSVEDLPQQGMAAVYDSGFVLGKGTEGEFWALLRRRCGLKGEDDALTQRMLQGFVLRPWMLELVKSMHRQGYVTGILSDQTDWLDRLNARDHFYTVFDHIFNSYYLGKGKQDGSLFADVAERLQVAPGKIVFVDDSAGNVQRAQAAGLQAIHYVDKDSFLAALEGLLGKDLAA